MSERSGRGKDVKDAAGKQVQAGQRRGLPCVCAVLLGHQVAGGLEEVSRGRDPFTPKCGRPQGRGGGEPLIRGSLKGASLSRRGGSLGVHEGLRRGRVPGAPGGRGNV